MPHTTPKPSRIPGPLHKAGLFVLFAAITAALCLLLNFLLVDDLHAYSRVTLGEYYAQADRFWLELVKIPFYFHESHVIRT